MSLQIIINLKEHSLKKRELSAIDSIYEVLDRIKNIEKHYELLNKQSAVINNKLNKLLKYIEDVPDVKEESAIPTAKPFVSTYSDFKTKDKEVVQAPEKQSEGLVLGKVKVFSKLLTPAKQPIPDVNVRIYDFSNNIVRNILSDKSGYWESRLPPGRYRLTMDHSNFKTIEKEIKLGDDITSYEVR
jgi:hypothetical protein